MSDLILITKFGIMFWEVYLIMCNKIYYKLLVLYMINKLKFVYYVLNKLCWLIQYTFLTSIYVMASNETNFYKNLDIVMAWFS